MPPRPGQRAPRETAVVVALRERTRKMRHPPVSRTWLAQSRESQDDGRARAVECTFVSASRLSDRVLCCLCVCVLEMCSFANSVITKLPKKASTISRLPLAADARRGREEARPRRQNAFTRRLLLPVTVPPRHHSASLHFLLTSTMISLAPRRFHVAAPGVQNLPFYARAPRAPTAPTAVLTVCFK